jgi:putative oxidoreductase
VGIILWILQVLLAIMFLWHGYLFVAPPPELIEVMNAQFAPWFRVFLGTAEILAAIGLVLPSLTRILPWLTPLAATGLMIITISASFFHISKGEAGIAITTTILFILVSFVAYMRWKVYPIAIRNSTTASILT